MHCLPFQLYVLLEFVFFAPITRRYHILAVKGDDFHFEFFVIFLHYLFFLSLINIAHHKQDTEQNSQCTFDAIFTAFINIIHFLRYLR